MVMWHRHGRICIVIEIYNEKWDIDNYCSEIVSSSYACADLMHCCPAIETTLSDKRRVDQWCCDFFYFAYAIVSKRIVRSSFYYIPAGDGRCDV